MVCLAHCYRSLFLFLSCRKYLLRSLYSDLRNLSSDSGRELTPPNTPNTAQNTGIELNALPSPVSHGKSGNPTPYSSPNSFHSIVARSVFSLMFAESSMMFFVLMLQGLNIFSHSFVILLFCCNIRFYHAFMILGLVS